MIMIYIHVITRFKYRRMSRSDDRRVPYYLYLLFLYHTGVQYCVIFIEILKYAYINNTGKKDFVTRDLYLYIYKLLLKY